jgi:hypothetical protein
MKAGKLYRRRRTWPWRVVRWFVWARLHWPADCPKRAAGVSPFCRWCL